MKKQSNTSTERLLTYEEVCTVLKTSQATLRRYVKQGRFPAPSRSLSLPGRKSVAGQAVRGAA